MSHFCVVYMHGFNTIAFDRQMHTRTVCKDFLNVWRSSVVPVTGQEP